MPLLSVPRNNGQNTVLDTDFDIELGNTADEASDDPGKMICMTDAARKSISQTDQDMNNMNFRFR